MKRGLSYAVLLGVLMAAPTRSSSQADRIVPIAGADWNAGQSVALEHGRWFDGRRFVDRRSVYLVDGRISYRQPRRVVRRIDLHGGYVIPPLGDAHTHMFDGAAGLRWQRPLFLSAGVFYAMNLTAPTSYVVKIRDQLRGPKNVDVVSSLGGITGPQSHPAEIYEANALGYYKYEQQLAHAAEIHASRKMWDDAYFVVETRADVDAKWPVILRNRPDIIKVFLRSSEHYAEHWKKWGAGGGIDPRLLPYIVAKAKRSGLRTAVAVSTAFDYRQALNAGAALISHMPCYQDTSAPGPYQDVNTPDECLLTDRDARLAASRHMANVIVVSEWANDRPAEIVGWEQANVGKLRRAGAMIAVGSDQYGANEIEGLIAGARKHLYPVTDILRWATMTTPRLIFPGRKIGCLTEGCEASLLVLQSDPLKDMAALKSIALRVKDGEPLLPSEYEAKSN